MTESLKRSLDHGINYVDTAEMYGFGEAETLLGNSLTELKVKREEIVISTKIYFGAGPGTPAERFGNYYRNRGNNSVGLSRKHIIEGTKGCLKRLQIDYLDIVFASRPDREVPLEEICRAFSWLIDNNLALYWGTSEWEACDIIEAIQLCEKLNLHKPVVEQCEYNVLHRQRFERDYRTLFEKYGYGTTTWSPLAQGFLSGKYNDGNVPEDCRVKKWDPFWGNWL
jgi:aryl-alcohol dehydrogenase-like predicted oxidoreductase